MNLNIHTRIETNEKGFYVIIASKEVKDAIWRLISNDSINPGIAHYTSGESTRIIVAPNPGYDSANDPRGIVAHMVFALTVLGEVNNRFGVLLDQHFPTALEVLGYAPSSDYGTYSEELLDEFLRRFLAYKVGQKLTRALEDIPGLNRSLAIDLATEAQKAYQRLLYVDLTKLVVLSKGDIQRAASEGQSKLKEIQDFKDRVIETNDEIAGIKGRLRLKIAELKSIILASKNQAPSAYLSTSFEALEEEIDTEFLNWGLETDAIKKRFDEIRKIAQEIIASAPPA